MKKRYYSPQEKAQAIRTLQENEGNISHVSNLLNIPVRTLYDWLKKEKSRLLQEKNVPPPPQNLQNPQNSPVPPLQESAFGMTKDELIRALEIEYIPSPYEDMRQALMMHINFLLPTVAEDPDTAHVRALAISRMLDDVMRLEPLCRLEKPQLNIIKYEYKDGTYHDIPEWSNKVYERAEQAFNAVLVQAREEYYAFKGETPPTFRYLVSLGQEPDEIEQPTLAELAQMHFTAEDFVPQHTGIFAYMLNRDKAKDQFSEPNPTDYGFFDVD